jgi:hypothetical protein
MKRLIIFLLIISSGLLIFNSQALAEFNHDYLISEKELTNYQAMDLKEIENFLKKYNSILANYKTIDIDGKVRSAAEIIFNASQKYQINPEVLITLIQKEQGLITKKFAHQNQLDWATGFACYENYKIEKFKGFALQIDRAAWRLRYFLEHPDKFVFQPGKTYLISGFLITPQNLATAALYNYTPYILGNQIFFNIWRKWFKKKYEPIENNSLVKLKDEPGIWLIQNGKRRPFYSKNVFLASYSFKNVRIISKNDLLKYEIGEAMDYPEYSLLQNEKGEIYLKINKTIRFIPKNIFKEIGYNPEEIIKVPSDELKKYTLGKPILSPYPFGTLLQDMKSGIIYYVKDEFKSPIISKEILSINFPYDKIIKVNSEKLEKFILSEPVKLKDGTLIKSMKEPTVYLISQGKRRPIASPEVFVALGYRWENVITVSDEVLNLHELGEKITIE